MMGLSAKDVRGGFYRYYAWSTSKLSSDESITVFDAVAMSAINDAASNFLGDCLISVELAIHNLIPLTLCTALALLHYCSLLSKHCVSFPAAWVKAFPRKMVRDILRNYAGARAGTGGVIAR